MSARRSALLLIVVTGSLAGGCYQEVRIDDPDGSPPPWDAGPRGSRFVPPAGKCSEPTGVDLLFLVDNSNSTVEEQASLVAELPQLVTALIDPPDEDGDGEPDWLPVPDLHLGVITPDMGTGGFTVPTCAGSDFGDDGILRREGPSGVSGCAITYPTFLTFEPTTGSAEQVAADLGCLATVGTAGCGFEQPLEAVLKALSPSGSTAYTGPDFDPPRFFRDTLGHALTDNDGFLRADTLLAVVVVTDEDDCSARDPELFNPASVDYGTTDLNLRCSEHAEEALHPISRYVDGLRALRRDREDLIAFAVLAGVPPDLVVPIETEASLDAILADPRMQETIDPTAPTRLTPSCNSAGRGLAFPPRRIVEVARGLGPSRSTVQSICDESFSSARAAIARLVGRRACQTFTD